MSEPLIPFALHVASGEYVGVDEVPSGLACGCICPSCEIPLVARLSKNIDKRISYFAHQTQNNHDRTKRDCQFSFLVSVRAMAKQILMKSPHQFKTPAIIQTEQEREWMVETEIVRRGEFSYQSLPEQYFDIPSSTLISDCSFNGISVDICWQRPLPEKPLLLYCSFNERPVPIELYEPELLADVLEINLEYTQVFMNQESGQTFQSLLTEFLCQTVFAKHWVNHDAYDDLEIRFPELLAQKEAELEQAAREQAQLRPKLPPTQNIAMLPIKVSQNQLRQQRKSMKHFLKDVIRNGVPQHTEPELRHLSRYRCQLCRLEFECQACLPVCPNCNSHYYAVACK